LDFDKLSLPDLLQELVVMFPEKVAFSTSLSYEDQVITHHIFYNDLPIRVFTLDTGRIFPETYSVLNSTRERYKKDIEVYFPDFKISYAPDFRQAIADSWPKSIDDRVAKQDWNWEPAFDLEKMTADIVENLPLYFNYNAIK
jgi:3'-phosphoadenosine 5'-phosphosulfate sulfotransferase (PAPS reductase)/FAD synthetase